MDFAAVHGKELRWRKRILNYIIRKKKETNRLYRTAANAEIIPDNVGAVTAVPRRLALLVPTFTELPQFTRNMERL